jgi:hemin uptake protein HemP
MNNPDATVTSNTTGIGATEPAKRHRLKSIELLGKSREIIIEHGHDEYRLRLTSQNKLILTK